jgi:hypothetical protein
MIYFGLRYDDKGHYAEEVEKSLEMKAAKLSAVVIHFARA